MISFRDVSVMSRPAKQRFSTFLSLLLLSNWPEKQQYASFTMSVFKQNNRNVPVLFAVYTWGRYYWQNKRTSKWVKSTYWTWTAINAIIQHLVCCLSAGKVSLLSGCPWVPLPTAHLKFLAKDNWMCIKPIQLPMNSLPTTESSDLPGNKHKGVMQVSDWFRNEIGVCIHQGCPILLLEIYLYAEFSFNLAPKNLFIIIKTEKILINWFVCI